MFSGHMRMSLLLEAQEPNLSEHVCMSKGKYVTSKAQTVLNRAGLAQSFCPSDRTMTLVLNVVGPPPIRS